MTHSSIHTESKVTAVLNDSGEEYDENEFHEGHENEHLDGSDSDREGDAFNRTVENAWAKLDKKKVMREVDDLGIKKFIENSSRKTAASGAAAGFGGFTVSLLAFPADAAFVIYQQFRMTLGIMYHLTGQKDDGSYNVELQEVMRFIAKGIGLHATNLMTARTLGFAMGKYMAARYGGRVLAARAIAMAPIVGSAAVGGLNYFLTKRFGREMLTHGPKYVSRD